MRATITLHKKPSIIEIFINRVFFGCKTEYVVPDRIPSDIKFLCTTLASENARLNKELRYLRLDYEAAARVLDELIGLPYDDACKYLRSFRYEDAKPIIIDTELA